MEIQTGTVVWFSEGKGYGFIRPEGGDHEDEVFVHFTGIDGPPGRRNLLQGQKVEFQISPNDKPGKRPTATQVRVVS